MPLLVKLGICELAVAALSGWVMVALVEQPHTLERLGLRQPARIRQAHLDLLFMGAIVTVVGLAVQPIPTWVGGLLVAGAFVQPLMFLPIAVRPEIKAAFPYRAANAGFFTATSVAWVAIAVISLSR
jgi:hypothetical protein